MLYSMVSPLNAELNPIRHLLALVGARHIVHVSRVRVKYVWSCWGVGYHTWVVNGHRWSFLIYSLLMLQTSERGTIRLFALFVMFLLLWMRIARLHSTMNSSVARITDLTPAEFVLWLHSQQSCWRSCRRITANRYISSPLYSFRSLLFISFIVYPFCTLLYTFLFS